MCAEKICPIHECSDTGSEDSHRHDRNIQLFVHSHNKCNLQFQREKYTLPLLLNPFPHGIIWSLTSLVNVLSDQQILKETQKNQCSIQENQ